MLENVVIGNELGLEKIKSRFVKDGASKLHILADFDKTLTKAFVNGKSVPSMISILRDGNYLTKEYVEKARALSEKYYPIEVDPKIPLEEKKEVMRKWWTEHFNLLIKSKLNKKDIEKVVNSGKVELREGCLEFLDLLHKQDIPLIIMSSSGLGRESISRYFEKYNKLHKNIYIISNEFEWDKEGYLIRVEEPIIHAMNKDETLIKNFPIFDIIKNKKNVILLGDNIEDTGMVEGFDYNNLIKIGFLNESIEENLKYYKKAYDILILNDFDMKYVSNLLREIIS